MSDIVERLRACHGIPAGDPECNCAEAAAEIERLHDDIAQHIQEKIKLATEIERLNGDREKYFIENLDMKAEIERLKAERDGWEQTRLRAENAEHEDLMFRAMERAKKAEAEIERLRAALREAAVFLETAAPFLPDDVAVKHSFNNGETLQTRPLSVVLRACAKDARRALEGE